MLGMRMFVGLGLNVWLLGGLYFAFSPDILKIPHIIPFSLVRPTYRSYYER